MSLHDPEAAAKALADFPRRSLAFLPTPLVELPRLSAALGGSRIFMKRDDQTGLAAGGNKARKLEFLVGAAIAGGCDTLITGGALQSNHCRQTAAAAAACGLGCHLVLGGEAPERADGNLLLDELLGAAIHWSGERRKGEDIPAVAESLRAAGHRPYLIPYGGSSALGALGFALAAGELAGQVASMGLKPTRLVFASSSGGTHAGLMLGSRLFDLGGGAVGGCKLEGISIDKAEGERAGESFADRILALANEAAALLGLNSPFASSDVVLRKEFVGAGYGVVGNLERRAIRLAAQTEGILVDPVYTGRALGGLISMIEAGEFGRDETVVFWHTGGLPSIFAYSRELLEPH
jgi:L-cysteate sulfo-lyase